MCLSTKELFLSDLRKQNSSRSNNTMYTDRQSLNKSWNVWVYTEAQAHTSLWHKHPGKGPPVLKRLIYILWMTDLHSPSIYQVFCVEYTSWWARFCLTLKSLLDFCCSVTLLKAIEAWVLEEVSRAHRPRHQLASKESSSSNRKVFI